MPAFSIDALGLERSVETRLLVVTSKDGDSTRSIQEVTQFHCWGSRYTLRVSRHRGEWRDSGDEGTLKGVVIGSRRGGLQLAVPKRPMVTRRKLSNQTVVIITSTVIASLADIHGSGIT